MTVKLRAFHEPCHLARIVYGQCDGCGEWPEQLHLPTKKHGWYCAGCCPVCQQQRAVKAALAHPGGVGKSDSAIAKHVGVDHKTVLAWREKLETTREIPKSITRAGADGRTINTTNIGRKPEIREPEALRGVGRERRITHAVRRLQKSRPETPVPGAEGHYRFAT